MKIVLSSNGITTELIEEIDRGPYVMRRELWYHHSTQEPTEMFQAYTHDGHYIGDEKTAKMLCVKYGIAPELSDEDHQVCSIGYSEREGRWYGWSHRAIYGFKVGDKVKEGDCGYNPEVGEWTAETNEDAKQMAIQFADSVSHSLISVASSLVKVLTPVWVQEC